jgi:hypothetical protein
MRSSGLDATNPSYVEEVNQDQFIPGSLGSVTVEIESQRIPRHFWPAIRVDCYSRWMEANSIYEHDMPLMTRTLAMPSREVSASTSHFQVLSESSWAAIAGLSAS